MIHYRISEIKLRIGEPLSVLPARIEKKLRLAPGTIREGRWEVRRESVDARDKSEIRLVYTVDFELDRPLRIRKSQEKDLRQITGEERSVPEPGTEPLSARPVIAGFGPAGIFAALELARLGYRPIVLERGACMADRIEDVGRFRREGILDPESNVLFGEGGAGTFSDGKLTSGIKDGNIRYVLETFANAGADPDILYKHRPHIGTDVLRTVIVNLREEILSLGGEVRFGTKLDSLITKDSRLTGIRIVSGRSGSSAETPEARTEILPAQVLILAAGHSARDTFEMLRDAGLQMEQKPLSIGVRMEHPQALIDRAQYGEERRLPPADYKLSCRASSGRGVYSFCMCPGGEVIVCTTAPGELCVNGMSDRARDSGTANSGILCDVRTDDFGSDDVLAGIRFQQQYERLAFRLGQEQAAKKTGGAPEDACLRFVPPRSTMKEFLSNEGDGVYVNRALPDFASEAIREAVPVFARKIRGYDSDDAVVTAVETRSSSPVRILRDEQGESNIRGIYPAGEGAGYAGGITSAACDGIRAAHQIIRRYQKTQDGQSR
ncbi:MAG: NAD(FAD)-utilizing dehydrogenase [Mogibacterium sp.]|nr:NAD(FAD)-utilizing dehydrogenase [Mogibacterium sp.]